MGEVVTGEVVVDTEEGGGGQVCVAVPPTGAGKEREEQK